jgi:hypothetical protein
VSPGRRCPHAVLVGAHAHGMRGAARVGLDVRRCTALLKGFVYERVIAVAVCLWYGVICSGGCPA